MKLFYSPGACSLSPHIVLRELGLPFELERVDTKAGKTERGTDFLTVNPKGFVPVLELDDGRRITEAAIILQYLADLRPEAKLAPPPGTFERIRLQEWLNFIASDLHKLIGSLFQQQMPDAWREYTKGQIAKRLDYVAKELEGKTWLFGEQYTVADAYLFVVLRWTRGLDVELGKWPTLSAYFRRIRGRPAVEAAVNAEMAKPAGGAKSA